MIGKRIYEARKAAGMRQADLAEAAGTTQGYVSDIEQSKRGMTVGMLQRLAAALGIPPADLLK